MTVTMSMIRNAVRSAYRPQVNPLWVRLLFRHLLPQIPICGEAGRYFFWGY